MKSLWVLRGGMGLTSVYHYFSVSEESGDVQCAWSARSQAGRLADLAELERQFVMTLPKGACAAVDVAAEEFIAKHDVENLAKVAKMHFRTALRAQGLPKPPKTEWRRK